MEQQIELEREQQYIEDEAARKAEARQAAADRAGRGGCGA